MADAVYVRNACKSYGTGKNGTLVLNHLNMNVPTGSIYGLLGASGCGKTTLLGCIAGRLKLNSGDLNVLGGVPGTKGSGVPGPRVGYMPQEVALVSEMNVKNVIYYFGWLFGMSSSQIAERYKFLSKLLELPDENRMVKNLSGGQQRRVSFAAALIQTPELLILDEPTVGLDPVLRQSIWDYLVQISRDSHMTIIITTHYIEEATQAHKIGLLRKGTLLADMAPDVLITKYNCTTLEEVFLLLSQKQGIDHQCASSSSLPIKSDNKEGVEKSVNCIGNNILPDDVADVAYFNGKSVVFDEMKNNVKSNIDRPIPTWNNRMKALLYKDFLSIIRNKPGMLFTFLFPAIQIIIFFLAIGNEPYDLRLGIVNDEIPNCPELLADIRDQLVVHDNDTCSYYGLSCLFIEKLNALETVTAIPYVDKQSALVASKKLETRGTLYIPHNFSLYLEKRLIDGYNANTDTLDNGPIKIWLDMSNYLIGFKLQKFIYDKYFELTDYFADNCNSISRTTLHLPVKFHQPLYGENDQTFRVFMAPGVIITIVFYLSAMATTTIIATERDSGLWNRNLVAGVRVSETLSSHILSQVLGMFVQMSEVLLLSFFVFNLDCKGNVVTMVTLVFLQSFAGIMYGLFIGAFCKNSTDAMYLTIGTFFPYCMLIGACWPLESAPLLFQYISYCTPGTWPSKTLLNILSKGWGWLHPQVYPGFIITLAWIVVMFTMSVFKLRK